MGDINDNIKAASNGNPYTGDGITSLPSKEHTPIMGQPDILKHSLDSQPIMSKPTMLNESGDIITSGDILNEDQS